MRRKLINDDIVEVKLLDTYNVIKHLDKEIIKQRIITYMTKNLYRFGCFANSQKDRMAEHTVINFYHLVPISYMNNPCCITEYRHNKKLKLIEHFIQNPKIFWETPE